MAKKTASEVVQMAFDLSVNGVGQRDGEFEQIVKEELSDKPTFEADKKESASDAVKEAMRSFDDPDKPTITAGSGSVPEDEKRTALQGNEDRDFDGSVRVEKLDDGRSRLSMGFVIDPDESGLATDGMTPVSDTIEGVAGQLQIAEDAVQKKPKKQVKATASECGAKNVLTCPYHGPEHMAEELNKFLAAEGLDTESAAVEPVEGKKNAYVAWCTCDSGQEQKVKAAFAKFLDAAKIKANKAKVAEELVQQAFKTDWLDKNATHGGNIHEYGGTPKAKNATEAVKQAVEEAHEDEPDLDMGDPSTSELLQSVFKGQQAEKADAEAKAFLGNEKPNDGSKFTKEELHQVYKTIKDGGVGKFDTIRIEGDGDYLLITPLAGKSEADIEAMNKQVSDILKGKYTSKTAKSQGELNGTFIEIRKSKEEEGQQKPEVKPFSEQDFKNVADFLHAHNFTCSHMSNKGDHVEIHLKKSQGESGANEIKDAFANGMKGYKSSVKPEEDGFYAVYIEKDGNPPADTESGLTDKELEAFVAGTEFKFDDVKKTGDGKFFVSIGKADNLADPDANGLVDAIENGIEGTKCNVGFNEDGIVGVQVEYEKPQGGGEMKFPTDEMFKVAKHELGLWSTASISPDHVATTLNNFIGEAVYKNGAGVSESYAGGIEQEIGLLENAIKNGYTDLAKKYMTDLKELMKEGQEKADKIAQANAQEEPKKNIDKQLVSMITSKAKELSYKGKPMTTGLAEAINSLLGTSHDLSYVNGVDQLAKIADYSSKVFNALSMEDDATAGKELQGLGEYIQGLVGNGNGETSAATPKTPPAPAGNTPGKAFLKDCIEKYAVPNPDLSERLKQVMEKLYS